MKQTEQLYKRARVENLDNILPASKPPKPPKPSDMIPPSIIDPKYLESAFGYMQFITQLEE